MNDPYLSGKESIYFENAHSSASFVVLVSFLAFLAAVIILYAIFRRRIHAFCVSVDRHIARRHAERRNLQRIAQGYGEEIPEDEDGGAWPDEYGKEK